MRLARYHATATHAFEHWLDHAPVDPVSQIAETVSIWRLDGSCLRSASFDSTRNRPLRFPRSKAVGTP